MLELISQEEKQKAELNMTQKRLAEAQQKVPSFYPSETQSIENQVKHKRDEVEAWNWNLRLELELENSKRQNALLQEQLRVQTAHASPSLIEPARSNLHEATMIGPSPVQIFANVTHDGRMPFLSSSEGGKNELQTQGGSFAVPQGTAGPPPLQPPPPSHPPAGWEHHMQEQVTINFSLPDILNADFDLGSHPVLLPDDTMVDPMPI